MRLRALGLLTLVACATCREPVTPSATRVPSSLAVLSSPTASATVGAIAGTASVKVLDDAGSPIRGVVVTFALSRGSGKLSTVSARSDSLGVASSTYRAATTIGTNEISVYVTGVPVSKFTVVATAGAPRLFSFSLRSLKYSATADSLFVTATARDSFLNASGTAVTWTARNPALVGITPVGLGSAAVRVLSRAGSTYLVATSVAATDSILAIVQDSSSTPCTFQPTSTVSPAVGGSIQFDGGITCVSSSVAGAEYAIVAHLNSGAYSVAQSFEVTGDGITAPVAPFPVQPPAGALLLLPSGSTGRDARFEARMRAQERREIGPRVASARAATARASRQAPGMASNVAAAGTRLGDVLALNVNANDFCSTPDWRHGRVVSFSKTAIIVADTTNPPGGFTDDEYRSFGVEMDTLVTPVDTAAFGLATDIDQNGRVVIFFTRAVNELTPPGSPTGVVLGYYYLRDLLPRQSTFGDCPGSNVGEMFYLLVPDPTAKVNGNGRSKAFVTSSVVGTIAHEYQHLINASRRMYVNDALSVDEDVWLSEGLSHIAEELVFFRASGLAARANIGAGQLPSGSAARDAFDNYQYSNFARYRLYLTATESNSPLAGDDFLATRGATWAFLRYLVDRVRPNDGDFWRKLVNSRWTGVANMDTVLAGSGVTALGALRDWSTAVLTDDIAPPASSALQQGSWNFLSAFPGAYGQPFILTSRILLNGLTTAVGVVGGGTSYLRFGVAQNREALIRVTAQGGGPLPPGMRLTLVRIK